MYYSLRYSCPDLIICFNHHRKKILRLFPNIENKCENATKL